ncbi:MAG TPA: hypothetical protein VHB20_08500 [Verrucomicrobiae bacterium]|nr:hypothetical protein [Verrucomicrobiae bacterium]
MRKFICLLTGLAAMQWTAWDASAQIDPEKRSLVEMGYNQPFKGSAPLAGYAYLYLNEPDYLGTNITLRLAIAPVYLDSEVGFRHLLGPNTDLAFGLAGGGFADDYYEIHRGQYLRDQSFLGHAAETTVSLYHLFNPTDRVPLNGILRVQEHYSFFGRDDTSPNFALPKDHSSVNIRTGLRWGGRAPVLHPDLAFELAAWNETQFRTPAGAYGYNGDRTVEAFSDFYWGRALLIYTFPTTKQTMSVSLTAGSGVHLDRFDAYRMGGDLPLASEYPLVLPGYFYQELSARDFAAFTAEYTIPLGPKGRWSLTPIATAAKVDYLPGLEQSGHFNSGAGLTLGYRSKSGMWNTTVTYGYGFQAIRSDGRGGQSLAVMCQIDLGVRPGRSTYNPGAAPYQPPSVFRFLRNLF